MHPEKCSPRWVLIKLPLLRCWPPSACYFRTLSHVCAFSPFIESWWTWHIQARFWTSFVLLPVCNAAQPVAHLLWNYDSPPPPPPNPKPETVLHDWSFMLTGEPAGILRLPGTYRRAAVPYDVKRFGFRLEVVSVEESRKDGLLPVAILHGSILKAIAAVSFDAGTYSHNSPTYYQRQWQAKLALAGVQPCTRWLPNRR